MKIFVSTSHKQKYRANDFCWVPEGEAVMFGTGCDVEAIDGPCGCRRSMSGLICHKATTTFRVAEFDLTRDQFVELIDASYTTAGWKFATKKQARTMADRLIELAKPFKAGVVLEMREKIQVRKKR